MTIIEIVCSVISPHRQQHRFAASVVLPWAPGQRSRSTRKFANEPQFLVILERAMGFEPTTPTLARLDPKTAE